VPLANRPSRHRGGTFLTCRCLGSGRPRPVPLVASPSRRRGGKFPTCRCLGSGRPRPVPLAVPRLFRRASHPHDRHNRHIQ